MRILGNYQMTRFNRPYRGDGNDTGSHSSNEAEKDVDVAAAEEVQGAGRQDAKEQTQARETRAPSQQDRGTRRPDQAASKSIEQGTLIATTAGRPITGRMNAPISWPNSKRSYTCTSKPREKNLKNNRRHISS